MSVFEFCFDTKKLSIQRQKEHTNQTQFQSLFSNAMLLVSFECICSHDHDVYDECRNGNQFFCGLGAIVVAELK